MGYKNESDAVCPECLASFKLPFVPETGRLYYCPKCNIKNSDMTKSKYMKELIVYLYENLNLQSIWPERVSADTYDLLFTGPKSEEEPPFIPQGRRPTYICTTTWKPKDPLRLITDGPIPRAIVRITTKDKNIEKIIKKFVKKFGIEAEIPNAPFGEGTF